MPPFAATAAITVAFAAAFAAFYSENLGCSKIRIQKKNIKKQFPSQSSVSSSTDTAQISNKPLAN
jgi:hypothetical protein